MNPATEDRTKNQGEADRHALESDHKTLRGLMDQMGGLVAKLAAGDSSVETEMSGLLDEFRRLLVLHFDREEESGVLEQAAEAQPRFGRRVDELLLEHGEMRQSVDELSAGPGGRGWGDFQTRFDSFRSVFETHEQAENEVLMGAYLDDIGGHD